MSDSATNPAPQEDATKLTLLTPLDLASCSTGSVEERDELVRLLDTLIVHLEQQRSNLVEQIDQLRANLPDINVVNLHHPPTGSALPKHEAAGYDEFFGVEHVASESSAAVIVRSLLSACMAFFEMVTGNERFDSKLVATQARGFIVYAEVLVRALGESREIT